MVTNNSANIPTGTAGTILQGQGDGVSLALSTATYPSTATGTGKVLRADGTNWVASTATYPDTSGTTSNVMTSDGTNFNSSSFTGTDGITTISGSLTNAQIKALVATPIMILAAPGSGKMYYIFSAIGKLNYGGTNVFTAANGQTISLSYSTNNTITSLLASAQITQSSNQILATQPLISQTSTTYSLFSNQAIYIINPTAFEITGNAANNNTVAYSVSYQILTI